MRRLSLRWALVLALTATAVLVSVLVTVVLVGVTRDATYASRQEALLADFRESTAPFSRAVTLSAPDSEWEDYGEVLPGRTLIFDLQGPRKAGDLEIADIPDSVLGALGPETTDLQFRRGTLNGDEVFFVGGVLPAGDEDQQPRLAVVTAYSLEPERRQLLQLVGAGVAIGGIAVALAIVLGLFLGTALTRPLRRLARMAQQVGDGAVPEPARSAFPDIDKVAGTLAESSRSLSVSMAQLARREQEARRLVGDVAHELRTPLASMAAVSEILADFRQATPEEQAAAVRITTDGTRRLSMLVAEVLELSRMEAGAARISVSRGRLLAALQEAVLDADPERSGYVELSCPRSLVLVTDFARVRTVVSNLLTNALRYGAAPIRVSAAERGGGIIITVQDHGPGIPADRREHIFERFTVLDPARRRPDSSGLGLAIARENARLLGGTLALAGTETGATFVLALPAPPASWTADAAMV